MPVTIGAKPEHGFDQPLGLLSDCHRRIENFLGMLIRVLERSGGGQNWLAPEEREAMEAALRYFADAAPRHTQDEELSLFPRLRASQHPEALSALAHIQALEEDHQRVEKMHEEVHRLCRRWLDSGLLPGPNLHRLLHELRDIYAQHIRIEDRELFPLAARLLDSEQVAQIGAEMAHRRGLTADGRKI